MIVISFFSVFTFHLLCHGQSCEVGKAYFHVKKYENFKGNTLIMEKAKRTIVLLDSIVNTKKFQDSVLRYKGESGNTTFTENPELKNSGVLKKFISLNLQTSELRNNLIIISNKINFSVLRYF